MYLSISQENCLPLRKPPKGKQFKTYSGQCSYCGIKAPSGLDYHKENGEKKLACPLCHACLHIDQAAALQAGKIIWLPELTQWQLNALCAVIFLSLADEQKKKRELTGEAEQTSGLTLYDKMRSLYKAFEYRSAPIESFFGAPPTEFFKPSDPAFFVQQIFVAGKRGDFPIENLQGVRFLPKPGAFFPFIKSWSSLLESVPVDGWSDLVLEKPEEAVM